MVGESEVPMLVQRKKDDQTRLSSIFNESRVHYYGIFQQLYISLICLFHAVSGATHDPKCIFILLRWR